MNYIAQMSELKKVARITYLSDSAWNVDYERVRQLKVLLKHKRALRACYIHHSVGHLMTWNDAFKLTPGKYSIIPILTLATKAITSPDSN